MNILEVMLARNLDVPETELIMNDLSCYLAMCDSIALDMCKLKISKNEAYQAIDMIARALAIEVSGANESGDKIKVDADDIYFYCIHPMLHKYAKTVIDAVLTDKYTNHDEEELTPIVKESTRIIEDYIGIKDYRSGKYAAAVPVQ